MTSEAVITTTAIVHSRWLERRKVGMSALVLITGVRRCNRPLVSASAYARRLRIASTV